MTAQRKDFDPAMKQIIVNVGDLTIEEKQRVSEALAKIQNVRMCNPLYWDAVVLLYGPSSDEVNVGFGYYEVAKTTHTPQQVLAMAGMAPASEQVIVADTLIITDSSGNIVYDSTLGVLNHVIKKRANPGVKLDKNGAVMVEKRKVRTGFDKTKEYSVDVSMCSEEEKKEVQQAFFDVGIVWAGGGTGYQHLDKVQYTNTTDCGQVTTDCMFGNNTEDCNLTAQEFLGLVYEPEQVGHRHAELMAQYAEDAKTSKTPWELWEFLDQDDDWTTFRGTPGWYETSVYRRKPKTHSVHGVEIPDLRFTPKTYEEYCYPSPNHPSLAFRTQANYAHFNAADEHRIKNGLCYEISEEGKQAAILHAKAMLNIK